MIELNNNENFKNLETSKVNTSFWSRFTPVKKFLIKLIKFITPIAASLISLIVLKQFLAFEQETNDESKINDDHNKEDAKSKQPQELKTKESLSVFKDLEITAEDMKTSDDWIQ
jgi:hypothetical protein